jgi:hypothetical protein
MDPLTGVLVTACGLLALGGALKVARPAPAARALRTLRLPVSSPLVRLIGFGELFVAFAALVIGGRLAFAAQAACYVAFVVVATVFWRRGELPSCGCFGAVESPPSVVHVVVAAAAAALSAAAATFDAPAPVEQPWAVVAGIAALPLVYLLLVDLPRLLAAVRLHHDGESHLTSDAGIPAAAQREPHLEPHRERLPA